MTQQTPESTSQLARAGESPADGLARRMRQIWQESLPLITARVALIEQLSVAVHSGLPTESLRLEAAGAAHKLAGVLGSFGYPEGTEIARAIEQRLDAIQLESAEWKASSTTPSETVRELSFWLATNVARLRTILDLGDAR